MTYRYIILFAAAFFVVVCAAQNDSLKAQSALSPAEAARKFLDAEDKAKADVEIADKINAVVWQGIAGKILAEKTIDQLETLVKDVEKLAQTPKGAELQVVKFDLVYQKIETLKNAADKAGAEEAWEELGGELKNIDVAIGNQIDLSKDKIAETKKLQELQIQLRGELGRVEKAYEGFVQKLARFSEAKLGNKLIQAEKIRLELDSEIDTFSKGSKELGKALIEKGDAEKIRLSLKYIFEGGSSLDEQIANIEEVLRDGPDDAELWWVRLCNLRFIRLQMLSALETQYTGQIVDPLNDEIEKRTTIERRLTFLRDYYKGMIAEQFGHSGEAVKAFGDAAKSAETIEDELKAKSKLLELQVAL